MKSFSFIVFATSLVAAGPIAIREPATKDIDPFVAQFALTLEHLEVSLYAQGLARFDQAAFAKDGFAPFVRGRIEQIGQHEQTHVKVLSDLLSSLGSKPVQPCEYTFPFSDARSFVALSRNIEEGGQAAYLGAAPVVTRKDVLAYAGSILITEGRHAGWFSSSAQKEQPWSGAFGVPLDAQQIFSVASQFIKSCPTDNFDLGLTPLPKLSLDPPAPRVGQSLKVSYNVANATDGQGQHFLALKVASQLQPIFIKIENGQATLPAGLQGIVFALVTQTDQDASSASTLAGPTAIDFSFDSKASNF